MTTVRGPHAQNDGTKLERETILRWLSNVGVNGVAYSGFNMPASKKCKHVQTLQLEPSSHFAAEKHLQKLLTGAQKKHINEQRVLSTCDLAPQHVGWRAFSHTTLG